MRNGYRVNSILEGALYAVAATLLISGLLWLWLHNFVRLEGEFGPAPHPAERWSIRIHGAAAFVSLFLLGFVTAQHVIHAWIVRRNRWSGIVFVTLNAVLIGTGYLLYYAAGEDTRPVVSALHWMIGVAYPAFFAWHVLRGRALRRSAGSAIPRPVPASPPPRIPS